MENKKNKLPQHILTTSTLIVPIIIYLVINIFFFSITPDVTFHDVEITDLTAQHLEDDNYFVYSTKSDYTVSGEDIQYFGNRLGVMIDNETIIRVGFKYYRYDLVKVEDKEELQFINVKAELIKEKAGYSVPLIVIITLIVGAIVTLIILKKMHYAYRYPKFSVLVSLVLITVILWFINLIVGHLFGAFLVFTLSWIIYMIECGVRDGIFNENEAQKEQNKIMQQLAMASKMFK